MQKNKDGNTLQEQRQRASKRFVLFKSNRLKESDIKLTSLIQISSKIKIQITDNSNEKSNTHEKNDSITESLNQNN
jgi:hypothetical protein